jgi:Ala-tRNA(Pro) deacylase
MQTIDRLRSFIDQHRVGYELHEHAAAFTAEELAEAEHVRGNLVAKVVMAFAGERMVMLILPATRRVSLAKLSTLFGGRSVRLAHEEEFDPVFPDCDPGAMSPFGNLYGLPVYLDEALPEQERIVMPAGTHTHSIGIRGDDLRRLTGAVVASLSEPVGPDLGAG